MTGRRIGILAGVGLACVASFALLSNSEARPDERPPMRGPGGPGAGGSVEVSMKEMGRALRKLRGSIEDSAAKEDNLRLLGEMERGCINAKNLPVPGDVLRHAADDAAKEKLAVEFRSHLLGLMRKLLDVEQSVMDGKNDVAKTQLEEVFKLQKAGHDAMGLKEEEERGPRKGGGPAPQ